MNIMKTLLINIVDWFKTFHAIKMKTVTISDPRETFV